MIAKRVLLVGWDAADWKIIRPLLDRGEMPNLARLMESGVHGNIATLYPAYSPMLWTSIATGKRADQHRILGFLEPTPNGRDVRPVSNLGRKCKALWNILSQSGKRSAVIGWWPSHPAEPINGVMVSDLFAKAGQTAPLPPLVKHTVHPSEWAERLAELRVQPVELDLDLLRLFMSRVGEIDQKANTVVHSLAKLVAETMSVHAAATDVLADSEWDFAAVYYDSIDRFSHKFMQYHPPRPAWVDEAEFELAKDVIENVYRYHDAMLGTLVSLAGPEAHILVMSDHGFHSDQRRVAYIPAEMAGAALEHRHFGIVCLSGPGILSGEPIYGANLLDIAPTILHLFGLPVGEDMDGKVLVNALSQPVPIDSIPTWETVPGEDGRHSPDQQLDSAGNAEAMAQLVELGYIAPPARDIQRTLDECLFECQLNLARVYLDARRHGKAEPILTSLRKLEPLDYRPVQDLLECFLVRGAFGEADALLDEFDAGIELGAAEAGAELERRQRERPSSELQTDVNTDDMREQLDRKTLAERSWGYPFFRQMSRIRLKMARGQREEAAVLLEPLENLAVLGTPTLAWQVAQLAWQAGEPERSLQWCGKVLEADPEDWQAHGLLARIHHAAQRHDEAMAAAVESLALVYHQPALHCIVGQCLLAQRQWAEAEKSLRVAVAQMPGLIPAWTSLAQLCDSQAGRADEARRLRDHILRLLETQKEPAPDEPERSPDVVLPTFDERILPREPEAEIVVVSGLPRSGTSMMMQMLAAGGVKVWSDETRIADEDNPRGYLEHERVKNLAKDKDWLKDARGMAVKIVAPLLTHVPSGERTRVVFMNRNLDDVLASQRAMLERQGQSAADDRSLKVAYARILRNVKAWFDHRRDVSVLPVDYEAVLADPAGTAERLGAFLGPDFDVIRAAAAVDASLRRQGKTS